jgi:hypothetical protein
MKEDLCLLELELAVCEEELQYLGSNSKPKFSANVLQETKNIDAEIRRLCANCSMTCELSVELLDETVGLRAWTIKYKDDAYTRTEREMFVGYYVSEGGYKIDRFRKLYRDIFALAQGITLGDGIVQRRA